MSALSRIVRMLPAAGAAVVMASSTAAGQALTTAVVGIVRDSSGQPIALAHVSAATVLSLSDSTGRFSMENLPVGRIPVRVRRLGFEPVDLQIDLVSGRRDSLVITLTVLPVDLPGVVTHGDEHLQFRLADFYRHRENGMGRYFDRKQIVAMRVSQTSDVLRRLPGVRLIPDRSGRYVLRMGRNSSRNCPPDIWVDGIRAQFLNVDDLPISDVEALEVYHGPSGLPPEYNSRFGNPACGAVIIWTRVPG